MVRQGVPEARRDASWRVRERLDLAAITEGSSDGQLFDEIRDGQRFCGPVGAAVGPPPTAQPVVPWAGRCSTTVSQEGMNTLS